MSRRVQPRPQPPIGDRLSHSLRHGGRVLRSTNPVTPWATTSGSDPDFAVTPAAQVSHQGGCVVPAGATSCEITDLRDGQTYQVRVRALTGAGWGVWSDTVTVVPEPAAPFIMITGSREQRTVPFEGVSRGLLGATVQSMVTLGGSTEVIPGSTRTVDAEGELTWKRRTSRSVEVRFTTSDISSNMITVPARD